MERKDSAERAFFIACILALVGITTFYFVFFPTVTHTPLTPDASSPVIEMGDPLLEFNEPDNMLPCPSGYEPLKRPLIGCAKSGHPLLTNPPQEQ
jgi:hypothetical protein